MVYAWMTLALTVSTDDHRIDYFEGKVTNAGNFYAATPKHPAWLWGYLRMRHGFIQ